MKIFYCRFKNESDLVKLAQQGYAYLYDLHRSKLPYNKNSASLKFTPVKSSDQGFYFCMYLKYMLFKVVHIKVTEKKWNSSLACKKDKFRCGASGHCINLHYKCDGKEDCLDGSDEYPTVCGGDPCRGTTVYSEYKIDSNINFGVFFVRRKNTLFGWTLYSNHLVL